MKQINKYIMVCFCILNIWGCDQKSTTKSPIRSTRQTRNGQLQNYGINNNGIVQNGNTNSNANWGKVYSAYDAQFNEALKALVSASFDPSQLGYVNSQNGVFLQGFMDINQNTINATTSNLKISIWDSYAQSGQSTAIDLTFANARAAQFLGNNQFNITFEDQYGAIILTGVINGSTITGKVSYQNYKSFDNASQPHQGDLGDFQIPTCSFIRCN
jgi:hypothetical protein